MALASIKDILAAKGCVDVLAKMGVSKGDCSRTTSFTGHSGEERKKLSAKATDVPRLAAAEEPARRKRVNSEPRQLPAYDSRGLFLGRLTNEEVCRLLGPEGDLWWESVNLEIILSKEATPEQEISIAGLNSYNVYVTDGHTTKSKGLKTLPQIIASYGWNWEVSAGGYAVTISGRRTEHKPGGNVFFSKSYKVFHEDGLSLGQMSLSEVIDRFGRTSAYDGSFPCWERRGQSLYLKRFPPNTVRIDVYNQVPSACCSNGSVSYETRFFASVPLRNIEGAINPNWKHDRLWTKVVLPPDIRAVRKTDRDGNEKTSFVRVEFKAIGLVAKYASQYNNNVQSYIFSHYDDADIEGYIERDVKRHPERYESIQSYEHVRQRVVGLANRYLHGEEDKRDELIEEAHIFVFDDRVWWAANNCSEPLTRLPYPVCIVSEESVLLYCVDSKIEALPLEGGANIERARRLMSFVVNYCCRVPDDDSIAFIVKGGMAEQNARAHVHMSNALSPSESHVILGKINWSKCGGGTGTHASPVEHYRRGFWRNQACGPGLRQHKRIWVSETIVTPGGARHDIRDPKRIHRVTLSIG